MRKLIKNGTLVSDGKRFKGSLLIDGDFISKIIKVSDYKDVSEYNSFIDKLLEGSDVIEAEGLCVLPGVIDAHVHFREPGASQVADIQSESRAAVLGGVTSFMDMPNTSPATTTMQLWEDKARRAAATSMANYSFYIGATNDNIEEIVRLPIDMVCGVKVFMGASTGNLLVSDPKALEAVFALSPILVAAHCEDNAIIAANAAYWARFASQLPANVHELIRSREACVKSSALALRLAEKYGATFHLLHVSTLDEVAMVKEAKSRCNGATGRGRITAETAPHYLQYTSDDYARLGSAIKCNPSIKTAADRDALFEGLRDGTIDSIASDHAPHPLIEKQKPYLEAPSGIASVGESLGVMLAFCDEGKLSVETVVEKMCHAPARIFGVFKRGFLREGYYADIVVTSRGGAALPEAVFVNGALVASKGRLTGLRRPMQLTFNR